MRRVGAAVQPDALLASGHTQRRALLQHRCPTTWTWCSRARARRPLQPCSASMNDPNRNRKPQMSRIEAFMRSTPGLNRFVDGTLIAGDVVMVLATQVSTERLTWEELPYFAGVAALSWVAAGALHGDYSATPDPDDNPLSDAMGWPVLRAIVTALITWGLAMVPAMCGYSFLVSNWMVPADSVLEIARDGQLSPQMEVSVSLLVTMGCWRGMAARLRTMGGV